MGWIPLGGQEQEEKNHLGGGRYGSLGQGDGMQRTCRRFGGAELM